jgi:hypothetical protein
MMVRFECGCVGFPPRDSTAEAKALLIQLCDDDQWTFSGVDVDFDYRSHMGAKSYTPLDPVEEQRLVEAVQSLMSGGYTLRKTQSRIQSVLTSLGIQEA